MTEILLLVTLLMLGLNTMVLSVFMYRLHNSSMFQRLNTEEQDWEIKEQS